MTRLLVSALVLTFLAGRGTSTCAQDAKSVLDKALKAMGGEKKLAEIKALFWNDPTRFLVKLSASSRRESYER